ncbi:MAG: CRTAC1 family protein [Planctomycetes bacterium]|nr:CRTAC1 family protein [Planctomycetota bacterium]
MLRRVKTDTSKNSLFASLSVTAIGAVICAAGLWACEGEKQSAPVAETLATKSQPWFEEISDRANLKFAHESGHVERNYFPEIMAGGAALFDMDGDGDLDIYLVQSSSLTNPPEERAPNRLYKNQGDGTFIDVTQGSGADDRGYGMGVATGDYDNDGDVDLYITNVQENVLLANDGTGIFTDVTSQAGVGNTSWSTSAAFVDIDLDGDLDLFVANYVHWNLNDDVACRSNSGELDYCSPNSYDAPIPDVLYLNNGDGTFTDISLQAGFRSAFGNGLGVVCGDVDGNGLPDIFVANDQMPNQLWINIDGKSFEDQAMLYGCAVDQNGDAKAGMGTTAIDYDDDGDLDLFVVNLQSEPDTLYRNQGSYFTDDTSAVGLGSISQRYTRFGTSITDFDNDGWLDIFTANGRVTSSTDLQGEQQDAYAELNLLLSGDAAGRFTQVTPAGGTVEKIIKTSRAAVFGDIDNDGSIDILVVNRDAQVSLLHNIAPGKGDWIIFRVVDEHNRDAIGATVQISLGQRRISREVRSAYSYCAANDPRVHFGLGSISQITEVSVRWIDGTVESFGQFTANQITTLKRNRGL